MIQLRINNESDLYNPYDPSRTKISNEVYPYLKSFCSELEYQKHMHDTLQVITDEPIDEKTSGNRSVLPSMATCLNSTDRSL